MPHTVTDCLGFPIDADKCHEKTFIYTHGIFSKHSSFEMYKVIMATIKNINILFYTMNRVYIIPFCCFLFVFHISLTLSRAQHNILYVHTYYYYKRPVIIIRIAPIRTRHYWPRWWNGVKYKVFKVFTVYTQHISDNCYSIPWSSHNTKTRGT